MRKLFTAIAIVAVSFTAPSAVGEEAVSESREELASLWNPEQTQQVAASESTQANYTGMHEIDIDGVTGPWEGNFRGGRVHPPAGR